MYHSRGLRTALAREDLGELGWSWTLDDAGRLESAERRFFENGQAAEGSSGQLTSQPTAYAFDYDHTENLTAKRQRGRCGEITTDLPLGPSGRNRAGAIGSTQLTWDDAGRLTHKADLRFAYDANGLLTEVKDDSGTVLATYAYDTLNRRVLRTVGGTSYRTVWDGWRPIEEYEVVDDRDDLLISRRTYGLGSTTS